MKKNALWILWIGAVIAFSLLPGPLSASQVRVRLPNGLYVTRDVVSLREARYNNIVPQRFDLSCGAAALATILKYYYNETVSELGIINEMLKRGDGDKIGEKGFSLLDLKRYAEHHNYLANGYRAEIENLRKLKIPGIILLDSGKYTHFVVLKGIRGKRIYLADPASGNRSMVLDDFENQWNGVVFLVASKNKNRAVSELKAESTLSAPLMSVMRLQQLGVGRVSFCRMPGEF